MVYFLAPTKARIRSEFLVPYVHRGERRFIHSIIHPRHFNFQVPKGCVVLRSTSIRFVFIKLESSQQLKAVLINYVVYFKNQSQLPSSSPHYSSHHTYIHITQLKKVAIALALR
jgi:hypothetical protein